MLCVVVAVAVVVGDIDATAVIIGVVVVVCAGCCLLFVAEKRGNARRPWPRHEVRPLTEER